MKITIAYLPEEKEEAEKARGITLFLQHLFPGAKVRKSDHHPPFRHIYLTTRKPKIPCDSKENT